MAEARGKVSGTAREVARGLAVGAEVNKTEREHVVGAQVGGVVGELAVGAEVSEAERERVVGAQVSGVGREPAVGTEVSEV